MALQLPYSHTPVDVFITFTTFSHLPSYIVYYQHEQLSVMSLALQIYIQSRKNRAIQAVPDLACAGPVIASYGAGPKRGGQWVTTKICFRSFSDYVSLSTHLKKRKLQKL